MPSLYNVQRLSTEDSKVGKLSSSRIMYGMITAAVGGVSFWFPDLLFHLVFESRPGAQVLLLTILSPALAVIGSISLAMYYRRVGWPARVPLWILLGVWVLGPLSIGIGWTLDGGALANSVKWDEVAMGTLVFPFTIVMAIYDGTLAPLLLCTLILSVMSMKFWGRKFGRVTNQTCW